MYVHTFHQTGGDKHRLSIKMNSVDAIIEFPRGTQIVTASDTYMVEESFDLVEKAWQDAISFEADTTANIFAV